MQRKSFPFLFAGALALALAGCAGTGAAPRATKAQPEMSNKGMANLHLAQNYLSAGKRLVPATGAWRLPATGLGCGLAAHRGLFGVGRGERGLIRRPLSHIGDQHDL